VLSSRDVNVTAVGADGLLGALKDVGLEYYAIHGLSCVGKSVAIRLPQACRKLAASA
jgi:hypothetical protein